MGPSVTGVALVEETLVREVDVDVDGGGGVVLVFWVRVEEGLGFVSAGGGGEGEGGSKHEEGRTFGRVLVFGCVDLCMFR